MKKRNFVRKLNFLLCLSALNVKRQVLAENDLSNWFLRVSFLETVLPFESKKLWTDNFDLLLRSLPLPPLLHLNSRIKVLTAYGNSYYIRCGIAMQ